MTSIYLSLSLLTNLSLTYLSIEFVCYISLLFVLTPFSIAPTRAGAETRAPRNGVSKAGKVHTTSAQTSKSPWGNSNALSNYWILKRTTSRGRKKEKLGRSGSNAQSNQACANHNSTRESKHMDASVCSNARQLESVSRRFGFVAHPSLRFNAGVLKKTMFRHLSTIEIASGTNKLHRTAKHHSDIAGRWSSSTAESGPALAKHRDM